MNTYTHDLHVDMIVPKLKATNQKEIFTALSKQAEKHLNISAKALGQLLLKKEEKIGSGIGDGVAIPHIQVRGPQKPFTTLITLDKPVEFQAKDNEPVDIICMILSPEADGPLHLRRLSRISRLLKNKTLDSKLREARDTHSIRTLLMDPEGWLMAA